MKRIVSLLLAAVMLVSAVPIAFAADTNDYSQGTQVVFTAANNESYTITVPASLKPGQGGTVTLSGSWPDNKTVSVTADKTVTLTNSIKAADTKTLNVNFNGIGAVGSNTSSQTFTAPVSVDPITNALFGTWSGHFYYNVGTLDTPIVNPDGTSPVLEGDGQVFFTALPETLSFRSTAPMSEFQEVQVNGVTVDPSNYTMTEGSTIITLHEDYLMTLGAEAHQITVVSDSGSPSAGFSVRDTITYEAGDYIYTIMKDGFETLDKARTYYKVYMANQSGMTWEELLIANGLSSEEEAWPILANLLGVGLTEVTFVPSETATKYWSAAVIDRTKQTYEQMKNEILGVPVSDTSGCFENCTNLIEVPVLSSNLTAIDFAAFNDCDSLKSIVITNNNITAIKKSAFAGCQSLTSITIPSSVEAIGQATFSGCHNFTTIIFTGTETQWNAITFDETWNQFCGEITVTCTDGTVIIPAYGS